MLRLWNLINKEEGYAQKEKHPAIRVVSIDPASPLLQPFLLHLHLKTKSHPAYRVASTNRTAPSGYRFHKPT
jgi:hypothetical protein